MLINAYQDYSYYVNIHNVMCIQLTWHLLFSGRHYICVFVCYIFHIYRKEPFCVSMVCIFGLCV